MEVGRGRRRASRVNHGRLITRSSAPAACSYIAKVGAGTIASVPPGQQQRTIRSMPGSDPFVNMHCEGGTPAYAAILSLMSPY